MTTTLPSQMAALLAREQDQGPERIRVEERSRPEPGIGDVLIQVGAASFTPTELQWPSTWDKEPGLVARFLASTATNSAREPSRYQSVSPNTSPPTPNPVVPYPRATTVPETS